MAVYVKAEPGLNHSIIYTDSTGRYFRFSGGSWAWRNHNPGNLDAFFASWILKKRSLRHWKNFSVDYKQSKQLLRNNNCLICKVNLLMS